MEENNLFKERYFLERLLGRGNFSEVWLAKDTKTDIEVALKIYAPATGLDDNGLDILSREFALVVNANHKNLLKPLYYDSYQRKPFLVLPFCKRGSIVKETGKFSEEDAWRLLRDVSSGLAFLHAMNPPVIHQDIKPDNIMLGDNGTFMITDFGVSTHVRSTLRKSMSAAFSSAGTIAYMAPERFSKDNTPIMANDIYSLGATVYEMLTGDTPFGDDGGLVQKKGADVPQLPNQFSKQLNKVIVKCLAEDPWKRPTAEQLEKYAEDGLKGQAIKFVDEKTFFQKFKLLIISLILLLIGCVIGGGVWWNNKRLAEAERIKAAQIQQYNDSIIKVIDGYVAKADSFKIIGDAHYERYEEAYLSALDYYYKADESVKLISQPAQTFDNYQEKRDDVINELRRAYNELMEKRDFFAEDADMMREFDERIRKIESAVKVN